MRNIRLTIGYNGSRYSGFQKQPGKETIQSLLEKAVSAVTGEQTTVMGSGRTDAGVHARGQVVHFHTGTRIPAGRWCAALNSLLPSDIVVWEAEEVELTFHARKSAKRKTYCYTINANRFMDPLRQHIELHHPGPLQVDAMQAALSQFAGEHDFSSFCSIRAKGESRVRTIYEARLEHVLVPGMERAAGQGVVRLFITGNGFLYHMVRIIAGTVIAVGEGKLSPEDIPRIFAARNRSHAGPTAKPHGLTLWSVEYSVNG